jgi:hypothetical protein
MKNVDGNVNAKVKLCNCYFKTYKTYAKKLSESVLVVKFMLIININNEYNEDR